MTNEQIKEFTDRLNWLKDDIDLGCQIPNTLLMDNEDAKQALLIIEQLQQEKAELIKTITEVREETSRACWLNTLIEDVDIILEQVLEGK